MAELIPFSSIVEEYEWDERDGPYPFTAEQVEAGNFLNKMDWEGGIDGLIGYGGWHYFPEPLQDLAKAYQDAHRALQKAINDWAAERGVYY